jgi:hypothetical protein
LRVLFNCCPDLKNKDSDSFWPPLCKDEESKESTLDIILKFFESHIRVNGLRYKLSIKTGKLSAFQMLFTHGIKGSLLIAKDETETDMKTVWLNKKQYILKMCPQRINSN